MKILFDLISQQDSVINGGSIYGLKILSELLTKSEVEVLGFYDSRKMLNKSAQSLCKKYSIRLFDISKDKLEVICEREDVDKVFISIVQRFRKISLEKIKCEVLIVCHDVVNLTLSQSGVYSLKKLTSYHNKITGQTLKLRGIFLKYFSGKYNYFRYYKFFEKLITKKNVHVITVSMYSKYALEYYFENFANPIEVFWSPQKNYLFDEEIKSNQIKQIVDSKQKYILLISCDRFNKNVQIFHKQFAKLNRKLNDEYKAVLLGRTKIKGDNILVLDAIEGSDLEHLYKNAELFVYPSLAEGFGYPPVEVMRHGTPVVASYCTSIPEVLGNHVIYFNPLYPEDLFFKIRVALNKKEEMRKLSFEGFENITDKQSADLEALLEKIYN